MLDSSLSRLAVGGVIALIFTLAYPSQLFILAPYWTRTQTLAFNAAVGAIWITYARVVFTDPGGPPSDWVPPVVGAEDAEDGRGRAGERRLVASGGRWCRRCERYKPARTHHCKTCGRCILRMDHHCPWTASCIGYRNLPHFLRFLFFTTATTSYLLLHLSFRAYAVWVSRHMPSYYSPHTLPQLLLLAVLILVDAPLSLALLVLLIRTVAQAAEGYTTIETWELSRHRALVRRGVARNQVFPYDVGLWENIVAAFGYQWFMPLWFNPFARTPVVGENKRLPGVRGGLAAGIEWEVNGIESPDKEWPPKDPEKEARRERLERSGAFSILEDSVDRVDWAGEVRRRQQADLKRWQKSPEPIPFARFRTGAATLPASLANGYSAASARVPQSGGGDRGYKVELEVAAESEWGGDSIFSVGDSEEWRNSDGERLADYGVDEDVEDEDENVPLALLLQRLQREAERVGGVLGEVNTNVLLD